MPGIPLVVRETIYSRGADQMCREDSRVHLTAEEEIAAEESLSIYCKPVELYNILQRRAIDRPSFLQRCLHYKQQAKNKRRIQMIISLSGNANDGLQTQSLFPMYILLARPLSNISEHSAVYHFSRICMLTNYIGVEEVNRSHVKFILPEMNKLLAEVKSGNFCILLVSCAEISGLLCGNDLIKNHTDMIYFPSNIGGYGFLGKISLELLYMSWEKSPNLSLGERAEMLTTVDMHPCVVKSSSLDKEKYISFQIPCNSGAVLPQRMPLQVPVDISAEEVGAKERKRELLTIHTHTVMFLPLHCLILLSKLSYRLPFTLGFIGSMVGTIYVSMVLHSYVLSVLFSVVQVLALSYYAISYFPGGSAGMKFLSSTLTSSILRCFGR